MMNKRGKGSAFSLTLAAVVLLLLGGRLAAQESASTEASGAEYVGADTCLSCHDNKSDFKDDIHAKAWPKAKGIDFSKSCETCHGPGSLHAAAAGDKTNPGYATLSKLAGANANAACLKCHEKGGQAHWAGSAHESHGVSCVSCHAVHGGHPKQLTKASVTETCFQCHKNVKAEMKRASHHPVEEGKMTCSDCHNPHGTLGKGLLAEGSLNDTCFKCHAEKRGPFLFEHRPVSEDCSVCHTPHGSNHGKLLAQKQPFLCQSCHSNSRHPGTMYAKNPNTAGSNTYQKLNTRALYRACLNCHQNIHGSNHPSGVYFVR